ncbi:MAG: carboxypeptidase regulatory-like domain-containing protein [Endomicrobiia bacterium]|nr:carboxypeptidase regulatory-like domain-containing protein [Endomicrobiia bacterium]
MKRKFLGIVVMSAMTGIISSTAYAVDIRAAYVADSLGSRRSAFSSTERISLRADVYNPSASDRLDFVFTIYDPAGIKVLEHAGNSIPGSVGNGGSALSDIHISKFYKTPGSYVYELKVSEVRSGAVFDSKTLRSSFFVYSPILTLNYPPNNAANLADNPLIFRWSGSGAVKYRISVDDDMAFYNTLFSAESFDTSYSYPQNPADIRQRLRGGQNYYWRVEGLDAFGNVIATSQQPFVFGIKDTASSQISRDIGIVAMSIEPLDETSVLIKVEIKNLGARGESNIPVSLFVDGLASGSFRIEFLNAGQSATADFRAAKPKSEKFIVTAAHNFIDDTPANNILTLTLAMPSEIAVARGRIIGKILEDEGGDKSKETGINAAVIAYAGPLSGETKSARNGQYQIPDLSLGMYKLSVSCPEYEPAEASVEISRNRAYPNVDFRLKKKPPATLISRNEFWAALKKYLSSATLSKLDGYEVSEISGVSDADYAAIADALKSGKARITNETLE